MPSIVEHVIPAILGRSPGYKFITSPNSPNSDLRMALPVHRKWSSSRTACVRTALHFYSTQQGHFFNPNSATFWASAKTSQEIPKSRGLPEVGMQKSLQPSLYLNM